jgi:hypothetical protein
VSGTHQPITPATGAEWRRRREVSSSLPAAPDDEAPQNGFDGEPRNGFDGKPRNGFDGKPRNGFDGKPLNGFRIPAYAPAVQSRDVAAGFAESQQAGLAAMRDIAKAGALPRPRPAAEATVLPAQALEAPPTSATPGPDSPVLVSSSPAAVVERPAISLRPGVNPPDHGTTQAGTGQGPAAAQASDSFAQLRALPLIVVLTMQVFLSLRLVTGNTAFTDEALYLWAGRLEWSHWLHHTAVPPFASYFSGAPVLYPALGALANSFGGLTGARILSLCFILGATVLLHGMTRRIFDRQSAVFAAALFAGLGSVQYLSAFATYDAMALFLLATATWLGVRAVECRTTAARLILVALAAAALVSADATKYAAALFDPVVLIAIASFHWRELGRRAGMIAGLLAAGGTAAGIAVAVAWGGQPYLTGIVSTTLTRPPGNWPIPGILFVSAGWVGACAILGVIGAIATSCAWRAAPHRVLAWTLAAAAFLAPAEQARIHVFTSLFKHVAFGGWFAAAVVGYALMAFIRAVPLAKSRGALYAVLSLIMLTSVAGLMLAADQYGNWASVNPVLPALTETLQAHPGSLLVDATAPYDYYLIGSEPWQRIAAIPRASPQAEKEIVRRRQFSVIVLSYTTGGGACENVDPAVKGTQAACPHNVDIRMLSYLLSSGGYRLAARIPYRTTAFTSAYMIWVREGLR